MRIFTVSDLHVDYKKNLDWVKNISNADFKNDLLILGGDISHHLNKTLKTIELLKNKFKEVTFVSGNHDVWIHQKDFKNSYLKHDELMKEVYQLEVHIKPFVFNEILIFPIFAWYDYSFGQPSSDLQNQWMDFYRCEWYNDDIQQTFKYFFDFNAAIPNVQTSKVISFSHFVPKMEVFPIKAPIIQLLAPCFGSQKIETFIRNIQSNIHIFGHSHLNRDENIDGIRYINNAFGYPKEERISRKRLLEIII